jgi:hypothetical protein
MSRPALATLDDLEPLTGAIAASDVERVTKLLAMASEVVRAYAATTWLNEDEDDVEDVPAQLPDVVAAIVERATRNPMGITQESAGPFSRSFGADASQRLYLTAAERMVVRAAVGRTSIGTLPTSRGPLETRAVDVLSVWGDDAPIEVTDPFSLVPE